MGPNEGYNRNEEAAGASIDLCNSFNTATPSQQPTAQTTQHTKGVQGSFYQNLTNNQNLHIPTIQKSNVRIDQPGNNKDLFKPGDTANLNRANAEFQATMQAARAQLRQAMIEAAKSTDNISANEIRNMFPEESGALVTAVSMAADPVSTGVYTVLSCKSINKDAYNEVLTKALNQLSSAKQENHMMTANEAGTANTKIVAQQQQQMNFNNFSPKDAHQLAMATKAQLYDIDLEGQKIKEGLQTVKDNEQHQNAQRDQYHASNTGKKLEVAIQQNNKSKMKELASPESAHQVCTASNTLRDIFGLKPKENTPELNNTEELAREFAAMARHMQNTPAYNISNMAA